jgi:hypothetical protein
MSPHKAETRRNPRSARRLRDLWAAEHRSAALYTGLASAATGQRREIFTELAAVERKHAAHWADKLAQLGEPVPEPGRPGPRTQVLSWLARRFSVDAVLPLVQCAEHTDAGLYEGDPDATPSMAVDERSHARVLTRLQNHGAGHQNPTAATQQRRHRPGRPLRLPRPAHK